MKSKTWKMLSPAIAITMYAVTILAVGMPQKLAAAPKPVTVVLAQPVDPATLDPHRASADYGANVFRNIAETLTTYDANDKLIPYLADKWEQKSDNEWIFYLHRGIKFSNGEPFNAEAVGFNLDRAMSTEFPRQGYAFKTYYRAGSWEAIDDYTIRITTTSENPMMPNHLCDLPIIAPGNAKKVGEQAIGAGGYVGTGPYVFKSWKHDQQITLERNPNYWGGKPFVDIYIIKAIPEAATRVAELVNGNVDIIYDVNSEFTNMLKAQGNINIESKMTRRVEYIAFNTVDWSPNSQLKDVRVRQAMNYAVDRQTILDKVMGGNGKVLASWYRTDFPSYDATIKMLPYNPAKAKALLEEAGLKNGFKIELQTNDGNHAKAIEVSQAVASYLKAVGIDCTVRTLEDSAARSMVINGQNKKQISGIFDWNWASKPMLLDTWLTGIVRSNGMSSYNLIPGYDGLVDKIVATIKLADKAPLLKELQKKLVEDPPFIYLFQLGSIYATTARLDWSTAQTQYILAAEMKVKAVR